MTKTEIASRLEKKYDCAFISISKVAKCLGKGRDGTKKLLVGVPYWQDGNEKKYFVEDIAEIIMKNRMY